MKNANDIIKSKKKEIEKMEKEVERFNKAISKYIGEYVRSYTTYMKVEDVVVEDDFPKDNSITLVGNSVRLESDDFYMVHDELSLDDSVEIVSESEFVDAVSEFCDSIKSHVMNEDAED